MTLHRAIPAVGVVMMVLLTAGVTLPGGMGRTKAKDPTSINTPRTLPPGSIPVVVVEEHHEVIKELFERTTAGGGVLIHYDSHPDLAFPVLPSIVSAHIAADDPRWGTELPLFADIADWILPFVLSQRITYITWVAPFWSEQFLEGKHNMILALDKGNTYILPDGSNDHEQYLYWSNVGLYQSQADALSNKSVKVPFTLHVVKELTPSSLPNIMDKEVIVDIDEDFFSCGNPLLENAKTLINNTHIYTLLQRTMSVPDSSAQDELTAFFSDMFAAGKKCRLAKRDDVIQQGLLTQDLLKELETWCDHRQKEGWDTNEITSSIDIGLGLPQAIVPNHVALRKVATEVANLRDIIANPHLILVAKSVGYTPYFQSPVVHNALLSELEIAYGDRVVPTASLAIDSCVLAHLSAQYPPVFVRGIVQRWHLTKVEVKWVNGTVSSVPPSVIITSSDNCDTIDGMLEGE